MGAGWAAGEKHGLGLRKVPDRFTDWLTAHAVRASYEG